MPLKTLHLTNAYHAASGGIRTFYHALLTSAGRQRREMVLVVPGAQTSVEWVNRHARIHTVRAPRAPFIDRRYRLILPHRYLRRQGDVWRLIEREQPDLVEICDKYSLCYLAGLIKRWIPENRRPALVGLSCERLDDNVRVFATSARIGATLGRRFLRDAYVRLFDAHIANSRYTAAEIEGLGKPVHVCGMGVDADTFLPARRAEAARAALRRRIGASRSATVLLYAGRISPEKNTGLLVDTMADLAAATARDYHLVIAGDGPSRSALVRDAAARVPGRVHVLEAVQDRNELADLFANADAFIHPNPREPFGIAPLEALASGLPLVAPASGGVRSYAHLGNAWLAQPEGADFAGAVRALLADPAEREARARLGRVTAEQRRWPLVAARFFDLYDQIAADVFARTRRTEFSQPLRLCRTASVP